MELKTLLTTVCKINYKDNCHNCPLRIEGKCKAITNYGKYNLELHEIAKEYLNSLSCYVYQSKEDKNAYYISNGKINSKGNYLLARLGMKDSFNLLVDELTLINDYKEISIN